MFDLVDRIIEEVWENTEIDKSKYSQEIKDKHLILHLDEPEFFGNHLRTKARTFGFGEWGMANHLGLEFNSHDVSSYAEYIQHAAAFFKKIEEISDFIISCEWK